jgi:hypothetical protein
MHTLAPAPRALACAPPLRAGASPMPRTLYVLTAPQLPHPPAYSPCPAGLALVSATNPLRPQPLSPSRTPGHRRNAFHPAACMHPPPPPAVAAAGGARVHVVGCVGAVWSSGVPGTAIAEQRAVSAAGAKCVSRRVAQGHHCVRQQQRWRWWQQVRPRARARARGAGAGAGVWVDRGGGGRWHARWGRSEACHAVSTSSRLFRVHACFRVCACVFARACVCEYVRSRVPGPLRGSVWWLRASIAAPLWCRHAAPASPHPQPPTPACRCSSSGAGYYAPSSVPNPGVQAAKDAYTQLFRQYRSDGTPVSYHGYSSGGVGAAAAVAAGAYATASSTPYSARSSGGSGGGSGSGSGSGGTTAGEYLRRTHSSGGTVGSFTPADASNAWARPAAAAAAPSGCVVGWVLHVLGPTRHSLTQRTHRRHTQTSAHKHAHTTHRAAHSKRTPYSGTGLYSACRYAQ